jgi:hypothetical protein
VPEPMRSHSVLCFRVAQVADLGAPSIEHTIGSKVEVMASGCWEWQGARSNAGYGTHGRVKVHRFVFEVLRGPIPPGMDLHHTCENPPCCNPEHIEMMTKGDHTAHHAALRRAAARSSTASR